MGMTINGVPLVSIRGGMITPVHTTIAVGVATTAVLAANANRRYAIFVNDSPNVIYLGLGVAAALNAGIRINGNGDYYEMSPEFGNLYTGAINAICSVAAQNLLATEGA